MKANLLRMENFEAWMNKISPKLTRKSYDSSTLVQEDIQKAQKKLLNELNETYEARNIIEKEKQENDSKEKSNTIEMEIEEKRTFDVCVLLRNLQLAIYRNQAPIADLKKALSSFTEEETIENFDKRENDNELKTLILSFKNQCSSIEKEISDQLEVFNEVLNKTIRSNKKNELLQTIRLAKDKNENLINLQSSIINLKKELIIKNKQKEELKAKLMEIEIEFEITEKKYETLHEESAEARSQLVQLELNEANFKDDQKIVEKIEEMQSKKKKIIEARKIALEKIENIKINLSDSKKTIENDEFGKFLNKVIDEKQTKVKDLKDEKIKKFIEDTENKKKIQQTRIQLGKLKIEKNDIMNFFNSCKIVENLIKLQKEKKEIAKNVEIITNEIQKSKKRNEQVSLNLSKFEEKVSKTIPKPILKRKSTSVKALDVTVDLQESEELLNVSNTSSMEHYPNIPKKFSSRSRNSISVFTPTQIVPAVINGHSVDPFEEKDKMKPLLTSTPIVNSNRRPKRAAVTKRAEENYYQSPIPEKKRQLKSSTKKGKRKNDK